MPEEKKLFSNDQVIRLLVGTFLIGGAWMRLEFKMDQMNDSTKAMFREYIIANDKDKIAVEVRLQNFKDQLDVNTMTIKAIADFIKPDEPKIEKYKR